MGNDLIGYGLCGIGLASLLCSFDTINSFLTKSAPFISGISDLYFQVIGGVLIMTGVFILAGRNKKSKNISEVPIYKGNQIVGYRREK